MRILPILCPCVLSVILCQASLAQQKDNQFPQQFTIAASGFIDIGPPFDFYEIYNVRQTEAGVFVERVNVSPPGLACFTPAKVDYSSGTISGSIFDLLAGHNPCAIPEKEIKKELRRKNCKHCMPVSSGSNVSVHLTCSTGERVLDISILDRDMFDPHADTPEQTRWSMQVFNKLDSVLKPGPWDQPIFAISADTPTPASIPEPLMIQQVAEGEFDNFFKSEKPLSEYYRESKIAINPPTITLINGPQDVAIAAPLPKYPPIAHLARIAGNVSVTFDIDGSGKPENISSDDEPKTTMLKKSTTEAVKTWLFPASAAGKKETATLSYKLNCDPNAK